MYFAVGWPRQLTTHANGSALVHISCNQDRLLFSVLTETTLSLWYCKPPVQIVSFQRSENSVTKFGHNLFCQWKPDSSMIAIITNIGYIIFYEVQVSKTLKNLYVKKERRENKDELLPDKEYEGIPALNLHQTYCILIDSGIHSAICLREELVVATGDGHLQRIRWDGVVNTDLSIDIYHIPFSVDLQHSRASQLYETGIYVRCLQYSSLIGGFAVVMSNGRAAFITANSLKFEPNNVVGVWAQELRDATVVAMNHRYMLMAFGCLSGKGVVYYLDEMTGALIVSHELAISTKDFPDAGAYCGPVSSLRWTPDGRALAMAFSNGGMSVWSVFGALLFHSLGADPSQVDGTSGPSTALVQSMEWGCEGYHLWMVSSASSTTRSSPDNPPKPAALLQLHFVKSVQAVMPCLSNQEYLFLQGEDKLFLSTDDPLTNHVHGSKDLDLQTAFLMNKHWQVVPIPHSYLASNWPIRFASVDSSGHLVAIAGKTGLAHYALYTRKWKLFGNESQEQDMIVTGGLGWWQDFICTACYNMVDQRDEVRFYSRESKLDNTFAKVIRVPSQIVLLNTFKDLLIVLCADCHIMLFKLQVIKGQNMPSLDIIKIQEVAIANFIPHPACAVGITLTSIRTESAKLQPLPQDPESILLNVAGRLLLFQRDRSSTPQPKEGNKERPLPFGPPVMVASCVENIWYCVHKNVSKPHLTEALWLGCGAFGMKVWLPLFPNNESTTRSFMSRRIMLPFPVDIYPLAVLFESGILLGASSESQSYLHKTSVAQGWPYLQLERTNQVYLHLILRQLLRRNLGNHALVVAASCTDLVHFGHMLELLVHDVLDEEATSKEPIPDPLLPRVVAFAQEFPEYLQIIAHCARKTEVALWQHFFSTVGNPKDLFEECLYKVQLETAASYLIILQNLEKPLVARQHATLLLDAALENCLWQLARDIVRFLKTIDPSEAESPNVHPKPRSTTMYSPPDGGQFVYPRGRTYSYPKEENSVPGKMPNPKSPVTTAKTDQTPNRKTSRTGSGGLGAQACGSLSKEDSTVEEFFIDVILHRHARKLLSSYRLRDLASFAANLEDYQFVGWLQRERLRAARIDDAVQALKKLHEDFLWPLPIIPFSDLHRLASFSSLSSVSESIATDDTSLEGASRPPRSSLHSSIEFLPKPKENGRGLPSDDSSLLTLADCSDISSAVGESDIPDTYDWSDTLSELEKISHELANRGPAQSDLELRYLFNILMEAVCLEWAMLLALILRDGLGVSRVVAMARDVPLEVCVRMSESLQAMFSWAEQHCSGYVPILQGLQGQTHQLQQLIADKQALQQPPAAATRPTRLRTISNSSHDPDPILEPQGSIDRDPGTPESSTDVPVSPGGTTAPDGLCAVS